MLNRTQENTIAIIDSGIDTENHILMKCVQGGVTIKNGEILSGFYDENGHGTKCVSTIMKYCKDANYFIIKVLNKDMEGTGNDIIHALNYIKESKIKIINLSLSTSNRYYKRDFEEICGELKENGKIVIASKDNSLSNRSYPSSCKNVIGVLGGIYLPENEFWYNNSYKFQAVSSSVPKLTLSLNNQYEMFSGNSKACAIFTGIIFNQLSTYDFDSKEIDSILRQAAVKRKWSYQSINNNISYTIDYEEKVNVNQKILDKIKSVIKDVLELDLERVKLLDQYILFYHNIGLNYKNCINLLDKLEREFSIKINYEDVSFFDCLSIYSLKNLVQRSSYEKPYKEG
ncbi:hypothetical protein acsn021_29230 [Anaerocolumna cellulosilytica]|uniref:Peptidase S8/S53 domain-containing protein n=1 Tax=Anaerocolumna cellulosilytica TaxID=433286 RepID=A0A6S6QXH8_9FIRM|nr:S8 family serine peptidase [Anaerocolumna cellulosilytica]MBB5197141.1 acyl carrier protein [Anaerocolumna cellulosilytica]BCJ95354.1 hypothetical protein acsn021_29230 [Anaerocolumna cellulosilytica]